MIPEFELVENILIVFLGGMLVWDAVYYPNKTVRTRTVVNATLLLMMVLK